MTNPRKDGTKEKTITMFMVTLYPNENAQDAVSLQFCIDLYDDVKYITHDKDEAKPHTHVLVLCTARQMNSIEKQTGIAKHRIEVLRSYDASLAYLVHANHPDKYQYDIDQIKGTLLTEQQIDNIINVRKKANEKRTEENARDFGLATILEFISTTKACSFTTVTKFCIENGLVSVLRSFGYIISQVIRETNSRNEEELTTELLHKQRGDFGRQELVTDEQIFNERNNFDETDVD